MLTPNLLVTAPSVNAAATAPMPCAVTRTDVAFASPLQDVGRHLRDEGDERRRDPDGQDHHDQHAAHGGMGDGEAQAVGKGPEDRAAIAVAVRHLDERDGDDDGEEAECVAPQRRADAADGDGDRAQMTAR